MHAFYCLPPILLTHSPFLGVVLPALVTPPPPPHTWSSSPWFIPPSYHELLPFVLENPFLSLGHHVLLSFSFVAPSSTTGSSCWWQMSHNQLQACSWLQAWGKLQTFVHIFSLQQHFYTDAAKSPFPEVQLLREFQVSLHHQDWIPVEIAWEKLQTMLSSRVSKHGWHFALEVLFWTVRACRCIISLPNIHSRSSRIECADEPSSYQP